MKMADGEEYEFDGNEVVSIEEGLMFLDEPADGNSAGTSGTDDDAATSATRIRSPAGSTRGKRSQRRSQCEKK